MNENMINWFEIPVDDFTRAKAFYESIFEFSLTELNIGDTHKMATFPVDQQSGKVGGGIMAGEGYVPSSNGALLYLNANPDLQNVLDRVESNGGSVVMPKRQISEDVGFMAVIIDTEGNRIALHSQA